MSNECRAIMTRYSWLGQGDQADGCLINPFFYHRRFYFFRFFRPPIEQLN
jgi:hypothetical protein